jgi:hypothetical protein
MLVVSMEYHYGAHTSTYMNALSGMHLEISECRFTRYTNTNNTNTGQFAKY